MHSASPIILPGTTGRAAIPAECRGGHDQLEATLAELGAALAQDCDLPGIAARAGRLALELGHADQAVDLLSLAAAQAGPAERAPACRLVAITLLALERPGAATAWARRSGDGALLARCLDSTPDYPQDSALADGLRRLAGRGVPYCRRLGGGHINRVLRVDQDGRSVVLRLGRFCAPPTSRFWRERTNMINAAGRHLAPAPLDMDVGDGTLVLPFLAGGAEPIAARLARHAEAVARLFSRLHDGPAFLGTADPFAKLDHRLARIAAHRFHMAPDLDALHQRFARLRAFLLATAGPPRPCHTDPLPGNFAIADGRVMLIDWQTAAMADPDWDLALFLSRAGFDAPTRARFLGALPGAGVERARARLALWEMMVHYLDLVEGLDLCLADPENDGWPVHARRALDWLRPKIVSGQAEQLLARLYHS